MRLLLVEDEKTVAANLINNLKNLYVVDLALTGESGLVKAETNNYQLLIVDIGLPDFNGFELIQELRTDDVSTPILILSGFSSEHDKATGLNAGADDYLTKPYSLVELQARIKALLRRKRQVQTPKLIKAGPVQFNTWTNTFKIRGYPLKLSSKEKLLLGCLIRNKGRIVTKQILNELVWGNLFLKSNSLQVHINRLRKKINQHCDHQLILTEYGQGYTIKK